jgi:hypothetical protein
MDEDAMAHPDWLASLAAGFANQQILGVGGAILPWWLSGRPDWFPEEFDWVVGCTYRGMPESASPVRNLIGCNMAFRMEVFKKVGGFRSEIGRVGTYPAGCEETEICIRALQKNPGTIFLFEPEARVTHRVPQARADLRYFINRCFAEGLSKALVSQMVGSHHGLSSERNYTLKTLPRGVFRGLGEAIFRLHRSGLKRAGMIVLGLGVTTAGFLARKLMLLKDKKKAVASPNLSIDQAG